MLVAVLITGTMNTFYQVHEQKHPTVLTLLEELEIPYHVFVYTNEFAFFKDPPKQYLGEVEENGTKVPTAHGYPIQKVDGHYWVCRIGEELIRQRCAEVYPNLKQVTIQNETNIYTSNVYLVAEKIQNNYAQVAEYEQKHQLNYDAFIYLRPDSYLADPETKLPKYRKLLKKFLDDLVVNPDRLYIATSHRKRINEYPFCSVSQSHAYAGRVSMPILAKMRAEMAQDELRIKRCANSRCLHFHEIPPGQELTECEKCGNPRFGALVTEYRIYQHLHRNQVPIFASPILLKKLR